MACSPIDRRLPTALLAVCLCALTPAAAEILDYDLEIPARQSASYSVDFDVLHPGLLAIDVEWSGTRVVSFRLTGPDPMGTLLRRSGPPPQRLEILVDDEAAGLEGTWKLSIRALPAREPAGGTIRLSLPDLADVEETPQTPAPVPAGQVEAEPWTIPRTAPARASVTRVLVFQAVERFRRLVIEDAEAPFDGYFWQKDFLRYVSERRDELGRPTAPTFSDSTIQMMEKFAHSIDAIESLRRSRDLIVNGPAPRDPSRLRAWQVVHDERFAASGDLLDEILGEVAGGFTPELEREDWPVKLATCLIACQRYFAERPRLGVDAPNREVAETQWERVLSAAEVLHRLLDAAPAP